MNEKAIETLLDAIQAVVDMKGTWQEKRFAIEAQAETNKKCHYDLEEFLAWFESTEE